MRVLVATVQRAIIGGVETYLRAVLPQLRDSGLEVGLVTAFPPIPGKPDILDGCPELPAWVAESPADVVIAAKTFQPDVVYSHSLPDPRGDAALVERFPTVLYAHAYYGSCVSGTKCFASPEWKTCSRRLGPACLALYGFRRCGGLNPVTALRLYSENRQRQKLLPRYRSILVASRHMASEVIRNGARENRVAVAPLFPPEVQPDSEEPRPRPWTNRVLFVGRMTAHKGCLELITVIQRASSVLERQLTLVMVGDGPDRPAFEAEARKQGIRVELLGWCEHDQVLDEMRAADVLAVPSVWPEPFGLVGIEAGCVGLPAVAFSTGGIADWLIPGVSGESAPGVQPQANEMADALVRALRENAHHQQLRVGAWEMAKQFTAENHLEGLTGVLNKACQPLRIPATR
ncbi:glycosyltransferase [bacterium]|nr:glycosyltransferase [bacterium]